MRKESLSAYPNDKSVRLHYVYGNILNNNSVITSKGCTKTACFPRTRQSQIGKPRLISCERIYTLHISNTLNNKKSCSSGGCVLWFVV